MLLASAYRWQPLLLRLPATTTLHVPPVPQPTRSQKPNPTSDLLLKNSLHFLSFSRFQPSGAASHPLLSSSAFHFLPSWIKETSFYGGVWNQTRCQQVAFSAFSDSSVKTQRHPLISIRPLRSSIISQLHLFPLSLTLLLSPPSIPCLPSTPGAGPEVLNSILTWCLSLDSSFIHSH